MSSPAMPAKRVADEAARHGDGEASRRGFLYFEPHKRRPSLYEETTVDTQVSPHRHLDGGWLISFANGRGTHSLGSTSMRVADWFEWRDPSGLWERPFYQRAAQAEREQDAAVATARDEGLFERIKPEWREFLRSRLQLPAFYELGLWRALAPAARPALSDGLTHAIVLNAAMKQRQAQDLVVYAMDVEPEIGECSTEDARTHFLEDDAWQPVRRLVEELNARYDWVERVVATNLCVEPLVGNLLRREMLLAPASANGDPVTPVIIGTAQREWLWAREWSAELARFLVDDPEHGDSNREQLAAWVDSWNATAAAAAEAMGRELDRVPLARSAREVLDHLGAERDELQASLGVAGASR